MSKKKKKGYGAQLAAVAPAFGIKALLGDLPKAGIEKAVESKLSGSKAPTMKLISEGLKGRGAGRALGAGLGIATAPLFLGGISMLNSKNSSDKAKGLALIGLSTGAYQTTKGFTEGFREARVANKSKAKSVVDGIRLGAIRTGYKLPMALALGMGVASGRKKSKDGKSPSTAKKLLTPALTGAALGAASRGGEGLVKDIMSGKKFTTALKQSLPKAGGGAAGGILGGLVLGGVIDSAMKSMEKKGSVEDMEKQADVMTHLLALPAIHAATKAGFGYGRIGQAMSKAPGLKNLMRVSEKAKQKQLALGIREGISGRQSAGLRSTLALNATIPELRLQREMGISFGKMLRGVPPELREQGLKRVADFVKNTPVMRYTKGGEPVPVLNQIPGAVDMATGATKMPGNALLNSILYGGRGGLGSKLPFAGRQDRASKGMLSKDNIGNMLSTAAGTTALLGAGATGGLGGLALGGLGGQLAMSGAKNIVSHSNLVKNMGLQQGAMVIREAFFPGMNKSVGAKIGDHLMDVGISPASRDLGKMVGGLSRGLVDHGRRASGRVAYQKYLNRAAGGEKLPWKDAITPPVLAGAAGAGIYNLRNPER